MEREDDEFIVVSTPFSAGTWAKEIFEAFSKNLVWPELEVVYTGKEYVVQLRRDDELG